MYPVLYAVFLLAGCLRRMFETYPTAKYMDDIIDTKIHCALLCILSCKDKRTHN